MSQKQENEKLKFKDLLTIDLKNIQSSNIQLFAVSIFILIISFYNPKKELKYVMIKGLFIILFIQILDYYTFKDRTSFLRHEKYLLSLSSLVGEALYLIYLAPRLK
jgi:hypothetical protein